MKWNNESRIFAVVTVSALFFAVTARGQQRHNPPSQQQPVVTRPTTSSVPATPHADNSPYSSAATAATRVRLAQGAVTGVIFWDTSTLQYDLSAPCQGLQVSLIDKTKNQLQPLATLTSFSPTWSTPQFNFADTSHGQGPWMACGYVFRQAPENTHLQVRATITQGSAFAPQPSVISAPGAQTSDLVIPGGNCNSTPASTLGSILFSAATICGENAFNVNFQVLPASVAHGMLPAGNTVPQLVRRPGASRPLLSSPLAHPLLSGPGQLLKNNSGSPTPLGGPQ